MINPFSLEFGVQPPEYIDRYDELSSIIEDFSSIYPSTHAYALLGPRGSGKTVLLNDIVEKLNLKEGWIAVNLNCKSDLLLQLAAVLDAKAHAHSGSLSAEFNFSFSFLTLSLKGKEKVQDIHVLLRKMLEALSRHNVNVLVGIDDIAINEHVETFVKEFQILRGLHLPIYLVMTGLHATFHGLQNQDGLTFLLRTPKLYLGPLNKRAIAASYEQALGVSKELAKKLAELTKGYAFAYQCLGYLMVRYEKKDIDDFVLAKLDHYLDDKKLWDELTEKEKEIVAFIAKQEVATNEELVNREIVSNSTISKYKSSLSQKGVVDTSLRGKMFLALPRFAEFVLEN